MGSHKLLSIVFTLIVLYGLITRATSTYNSPCRVPGCLCSIYRPASPSRDPNTQDQGHSFNVTCEVKFVSTKTKTIQNLPPQNIKSLTLTCTSQVHGLLLNTLLARFTSLEYLILDSCSFQTIQSRFISGLHNLQEIQFRRSTLLPSQWSIESRFLRILTFVDGYLHSIPNFYDNPQLKTLTIARNKALNGTLKFLNVEDRVHENLSTLRLVNNNLSFIPTVFFSSLSALEQVFLSKNNIKQLSFSDSTSLPNLRILEVLGNPLEFVETEAIASFTALKELRLQGSGTSLDIGFLTKLDQLQELKLSNFGINSSISDTLNSSSLVKLDLSFNRLTSFTRLQALSSLTHIRLQENFITTIKADAFGNQANLQVVNLTKNQLQSIPESTFHENLNLKAILLAGNSLKAIPKHLFSRNKELFYIDLKNNYLEQLSNETFMNLNKLLYLYLENNRIQSFPYLPSQSALTHFDISNNSITSLAYSDLRHLKKLILFKIKNNLITQIPPYLLTACPELLLTSFSHNQIKAIGYVGYHRKLQWLELDGNQLTSLPSFSSLVNLIILSLDDNSITTIARRTFPKSIITITLQHNALSYIRRDTFQDLPNLKHVMLNRNKRVLKIPQTSLGIFPNFSPRPIFYVAFTVLQCDCDMGYLKVWYDGNRLEENWAFSKYYPRFEGLEKAYCHFGNGMGNERPFPQVRLDQFVCNETGWEYCPYDCKCCDLETYYCPCYVTCPDGCYCNYAGSHFDVVSYSIKCSNLDLTSVPVGIHSSTTQLLLDGNDLGTVNTSFVHLFRTSDLGLNRSRVSSIADGAFLGMSNLQVLRLNDNNLTSIGLHTFDNLTSLRRLYMNNNRIRVIEENAFGGLISLEVLYLDTNALVKLNPILSLSSLKFVTLASNPWSCACSDGWDSVRYLLQLSNLNITDKQDMCCDITTPVNFTYNDYMANINDSLKYTRNHLETKIAYSSTAVSDSTKNISQSLLFLNDDTCYQLITLDYNLMCTYRNTSAVSKTIIENASSPVMPVLISLVIFLALLAILLVVGLWKRHVVQAWVYVNLGVRVFDEKAAADKEDKETKPFDAFVSFCQKDVGFIVNTLVPALEEKRYRVCVHYRDFPVGGDIHTVIQRAIKYSSRTILLVSQHFLKSGWCRYEFQTAHHHVLQKGSHRLIIVVVGELAPEDIDPDLRIQMKTKTYLNADDPWFWEKLYFALPDISGRAENVNGGVEDELKGMEILSREGDADDVIARENPEVDEADANEAIVEEIGLRDLQMPQGNPAFDDTVGHAEFRMEQWWGEIPATAI